MKKLSEFKDEQALDVLAEILESAISLISDNEFKLAILGDKENNLPPNKMKAINVCLRHHKAEIINIMAVLNETPVEEFHFNALTLPRMVLFMFNDRELIDFFKYQSQTDSETSSGSVTESTEGIEKE